MIHPTLQPVRHLGRTHRWHAATAVALLATALGALVGSTLSAVFDSAGVEWAGRIPLLRPLVALVAATSVYSQYRHLALDWLQARKARVLVSSASAILVAAAGLGQPGLALIGLWFMTGTTVIVTALAAGAGSTDEIEGPLRSVRTRVS